jgi:hypothetical protein
MGSKYAYISEYTIEIHLFAAQHLKISRRAESPRLLGQPDRPQAVNVADGVCKLSGDDLGTF